MGISRGLKDLRKQVDDAADRASGGGDYVKAKWLSLKDGDSIKIRFLQEIDPDSPDYDETRGLIFIASEVVDPGDYRKKCLDTLEDEGKSFGIEMHKKMQGSDGYKGGWKPKQRLYSNVLNVETNEVMILSQGLSGKSITPTLLEYATDEETGNPASITNKTFRIKRTGKDVSSTSYALVFLGEDKTPFDFSPYELYDLENTAVRHVPYAEQAEFFGVTEGHEPAASSATDVEW
jgi:hypothetical protein